MSLLSTITFGLMGKSKEGFFTQLIDKDNRKVSCMNFFTVLVSLVGCVLLAVPVLAILVELYYNHTVTMSWSDMATYIGAVAAMFVTVGATKAWSNYTESRYGACEKQSNESSFVDVEDAIQSINE